MRTYLMRQMTRPCPLCSSGSRQLWEGPRSAYLCTGCRVGWIDQADSVAQTETGDRWSDSYFERNYQPRAGALIQYFRSQIDALSLGAERGRWLDVGCGCGYFAAAALERGWDVTGIDPSPAALRIASSVAPGAELLCGTSGSLPEGARYDVISFWDSAGHIPDLGAELPRYLEHLAPGGKLIVKTPHRPPCLLQTARALLNWRPALRDDLVHARITHWHFTPRSLGYTLERHGLTVLGHHWEREVPDPGHGWELSPKAVLREVAERTLRMSAGPHSSFVLMAHKS
jgi:2-polyprenyl-3-methyl-5-hydroxy-6-metoxy-1,4-benzoquinol methylase